MGWILIVDGTLCLSYFKMDEDKSTQRSIFDLEQQQTNRVRLNKSFVEVEDTIPHHRQDLLKVGSLVC